MRLSHGTRLARLHRALGDSLRGVREGLDAVKTRSTDRLQRKLAGLKDCVDSLVRSQAAAMKA